MPTRRLTRLSIFTCAAVCCASAAASDGLRVNAAADAGGAANPYRLDNTRTDGGLQFAARTALASPAAGFGAANQTVVGLRIAADKRPMVERKH